jgi:hypothetical protein
MDCDHPSRAGPYERTVRRLITDADGCWWPDTRRVLALGCPPWLAACVAAEAGAELKAGPGGNVVTTVGDVTVIGCPELDGPGAGSLVVQDLISGWWYDVATRCHPDVAPHRWPHLTLALTAGLNPYAAVDLAGVGTN